MPETIVKDLESRMTQEEVGAVHGGGFFRLPVVTYLWNFKRKPNRAREEAQLANIDLQNMLQKQQQTLQMLSNLSKMLHDSAMAVIRKVG